MYLTRRLPLIQSTHVKHKENYESTRESHNNYTGSGLSRYSQLLSNEVQTRRKSLSLDYIYILWIL